MTVLSTHPEYAWWAKRYKLVRSILHNDAQCYIRTVDVADPIRSRQYKEDAVLTNFTRLTLDGLKGLVFRKPTVIELPDSLEYLEDDANGEGLGIEELAAKALGEVLQTGRCGLLVDYPKITPELNGFDKDNLGYKARIKVYKGESIRNFRRQHVGSKYMLTRVVLREDLDQADIDGYGWKPTFQIRELYLDFTGRYTQLVYNQNEELIEGPIVPLDAKGNPWYEIPFQFIGSENNDADYDTIPLYDLAILNLAHYRNSADLEESVFVTGQAFIVVNVGESSPEQFKETNPNGVQYGSRAGLTVGNGGGAQLLQANPNQLVDAVMKRKEEQAAAIGARLIAPPGAGRETAEGVRIRYSSQNSALHIICRNVSEAFEQALEWVALYQDAAIENDDSIVVELNTEFYEDTADPNLIMAMIQMTDRGILAKNDIRDYTRDVGIIPPRRTNEQIDAEAELMGDMLGMGANSDTGTDEPI